MILVDVYIEDPFLFNETLTYHSDTAILPGCRVLVEVQRSQRIGFVKKSFVGTVSFDTKPVIEIIDEEPIVNEELLELGLWMSRTTLNPLIRCFQAILPNQLRPSSSYQNKRLLTMVRAIDNTRLTTPLQQEVFDLIGSGMNYTEANKKFKTIPRKLLELSAIEKYTIEKEYEPQKIEITDSKIQLNDDQQQAIDQIDLSTQETYLLFGVTGSGKTEIYLQCAAEVLRTKKQVLVLVPEISLTPQMISRFQNRFGQDIGIYHSGLSAQEKYEQYKRVQKDEVSIVVGTRSAVFLPFENLGLIVMDEEHDDSFKQETSPFYHARDVVLKRAETHECPVILGSASPSLESYARGLKSNIKLLELNHRINRNLPKVMLIDTQKQLHNLSYQPISKPLLMALEKRLETGEQSILLLNRRSYSPIVSCRQCGYVLMCPHCETTLSYHKADNTYRCHTCDYVTSLSFCPVCSNTLFEHRGLGTQRLEEIVKQLLPDAKVLRMDKDTTTRKNAHLKMLQDFSSQKYDILIGTQMISKGLDIPNVTCVGIINPDAALMHEDFSSAERVFSMILQASGRAGRHHLPGEVYIQTYNPDHYAIQYALRQDFKRFFNQEMKYRHMGSYPPYSYLIEIVFSHPDRNRLEKVALNYQVHLSQTTSFQTLGPAFLRKLKNNQRMRIVLKGKNLDEMRTALYDYHQEAFKKLKGVRVTLNVNPLHLNS